MDAQLKEKFDATVSSAGKFLTSRPEEVAAATSTYDCQVVLGSAGGGYIHIDFSANGRKVAVFDGGFAGAFGGYLGWGKAWFNTPVEGLIGQSGAFAVEVIGILGGTAHVQLTGDGFIGNCSTGGIGAGGGVGAGGGKFGTP